MTSTDRKKQANCDGKEGKITGGSIALLVGLFIAGCIAVIAAAGISMAYERTNELLECRQRLANSPEASEGDKARVNKLQESIWVTTPYWVVAVSSALVGIVSFGCMSVTLPVLFWRAWHKMRARGKSAKGPPSDMTGSVGEK